MLFFAVFLPKFYNMV